MTAGALMAAAALAAWPGPCGAAEGPTDWEPMRLTSTADPVPGSEEVLAAWKLTSPTHFPNTNDSDPVLYQRYATRTGVAVIMIGYTPACSRGPRPEPGLTEVSRCPAKVRITSDEGPDRWLTSPACFQWNGQGAPGSANDPRTNSNYTRYDPVKDVVSLVSIGKGAVMLHCSQELTLANATVATSRRR